MAPGHAEKNSKGIILRPPHSSARLHPAHLGSCTTLMGPTLPTCLCVNRRLKENTEKRQMLMGATTHLVIAFYGRGPGNRNCPWAWVSSFRSQLREIGWDGEGQREAMLLAKRQEALLQPFICS